MNERPILFSGPMVRAILEGLKTQTRRPVKPQPSEDWCPIVDHYHPTKIDRSGEEYPGEEVFGAADCDEGRVCPYGQPGDRLWVRETWAHYRPFAGYETNLVIYRADLDDCGQCPLELDGEAVCVTPRDGWKPSIHMPRRASRITLEVTGVRVQRVQEIREEDAKAEGIERLDARTSDVTVIGRFRSTWDATYDKRGFGWDANPYVWVIEFERFGL